MLQCSGAGTKGSDQNLSPSFIWCNNRKKPLGKYKVPSHPPSVLCFAVTSLSYFSTSQCFCRGRINSLPGQSQNTSAWSVQGKDLCLLGQTDSCPSPRKVLLCWPGDLQPPLNQVERHKGKNSGVKEKTPWRLIYKARLEVESIRDAPCWCYYWKNCKRMEQRRQWSIFMVRNGSIWQKKNILHDTRYFGFSSIWKCAFLYLKECFLLGNKGSFDELC